MSNPKILNTDKYNSRFFSIKTPKGWVRIDIEMDHLDFFPSGTITDTQINLLKMYPEIHPQQEEFGYIVKRHQELYSHFTQAIETIYYEKFLEDSILGYQTADHFVVVHLKPLRFLLEEKGYKEMQPHFVLAKEEKHKELLEKIKQLQILLKVV